MSSSTQTNEVTYSHSMNHEELALLGLEETL
ncbi:MAG: hypothetical protein ACJA04_000643 [Cellvibrionaceae bacterium]|jgi:hypothetical protein